MAKKIETGVYVAWDVEEVDLARHDAGTVYDRTVVTARRIVTKRALYTKKVSDENIAKAEQYVESNRAMYQDLDNYRVLVVRQ